jgi:hypothetical protein
MQKESPLSRNEENPNSGKSKKNHKKTQPGHIFQEPVTKICRIEMPNPRPLSKEKESIRR